MGYLGSAAVLVALLGGGVAQAQAACGGPEAPCAVADGVYHVALPEGGGSPPAVLFLHGYGSSGAKVVANAELTAAFLERGYAVIAPVGQPYADSGTLDWGVKDGYYFARDDVAFLRDVLADAVARFGLDGERVLAMGYSRGGSMIWDLACAEPDTALAYAAFAGAFWEPMVTDCAAPVHLHHSHGFTDGTVPLEGRDVVFGGTEFGQGNVMKALDVWRHVNGCMTSADRSEADGPVWSKEWTSCAGGSITLMLTPGGHGMPEDWIANVLDWHEENVSAPPG